MYQIGLFSKINRITTKTLRHYDEIGLLKPEYIDDYTGYRFYSSSQLSRLHRIIALKQLGLGLGEISEVLQRPENTETLLRLRKNELEKRMAEEKQMLIQIQSALDNIKGDREMKYNAVIKSLPACIVASMRTTAPSYDSYFELIPPMGEEMARQGAVCAKPAYCFNIYHDGEYKENNIDIEVCEAVERFCDDSEKVKYKNMPGVPKAVCVLHRGPYSDLRDAYIFAYEWIERNGYKPSDNPRESYIDGIWNKEDEEDWLTELQIPVI